MLAATLAHLIEEKLTTPKQLAQVAGVAPSTVYRWLEREGEPDFSHLAALLSGLPEMKAREDILLALTGRSGFSVVPLTGALDVNHDGQVNHHDALESVCLAIEHTTDSLQAINQATRDRSLSKEELVRVQSLLQQAMHRCATTQAVLSDMNKGRKEAKRPPRTGS